MSSAAVPAAYAASARDKIGDLGQLVGTDANVLATVVQHTRDTASGV